MIQKFLTNLVLKERSANVLAASCALAAYVAFCPFIFLHTAMCLLFAWLFSLNFFVLLAVSNFINNPWTMIPVYSSGYIFGDWILQRLCGLDVTSMNPAWVCSLNETCYSYTGIQGISFWSFMVGGNLLGLLAAAMLYPILKPVFVRLTAQIHKTERMEIGHGNKNSSPE